jgi:hypothetical protein
MKERLAERFRPGQRLIEASEKLHQFEDETEAAYGIEPYEQFRGRYEAYADLTDEHERSMAEEDGVEWPGATLKAGTYSYDAAIEIHEASSRRMKDAETIMERMYKKEPFDNFAKVLSQYPTERQNVRRFKAYIDRETQSQLGFTDEQLGFQQYRRLNQGHWERVTFEEAQAEMDKYLKLTPEQKAAQKAQDSEDARRMGTLSRAGAQAEAAARKQGLG